MDIAFLFIAEPYQCYHGLAVAFELRRIPGVRVAIHYNDPESLHHFERIRHAYGEAPFEYIRMKRNLFAKLVERIGIFGFAKQSVYRSSEPELLKYDAIFTVEDTAFRLFENRAETLRPRKIYLPHGAGDGTVGFSPRLRSFDYVLLPGPKSAERMLALKHIRPDNHREVGLVKLETAERLARASGPLFETARPTVLYNAHKTRGLQSWSRFIEPMLADFAARDAYNLIVAPHVKLFRRRGARTKAYWRSRSTANILIDVGSDRSVDMSYTRAADIYVGDISSQVYEFLAHPRPCVFLNAYDIDWKADPAFAHWHLGDVISRPQDLMPAIEAAPARHHLYRDRQEARAAASLGDRRPGAAARAAEATVAFLRR
ncbi:hypothetical protein [Sphingomonas sp. NFR15]|uniref:hypothetical protein n=1 Tax=Sphingomonas sp. NFR15 TaxID=1566282 RepID=UPI000880A179|nr:hypothetical protein [Sphingomonas sp. NFR15]SDA24493.1 hypothetical protein SAMN03159340_01732 [Sphingomonas sp. NFR15]